jgi:hypothetical protein
VSTESIASARAPTRTVGPRGHRREQRVHQRVRGDPVGLALERAQDAVTQHGPRHLGEIREGHLRAAFEQRDGLGCEHEGLGAAHSRAEAHRTFHELGCARGRRITGAHQARREAQHGLGHHHVATRRAQLQHVALREQRRGHRRRAAGRTRQDLGDLVLARRRHHDLQQEPIELRFGQRVGAFHLDRVLRGEHEERLFQRVARAAQGARVLLHRLQQRALRLRRRAVDLVGQDHLPEDRPAVQHEAARAVLGVHQHVRAEHVARHQIGRELDAREAQVEARGEGAHEQRLAQARRAFQQHVPSGEQPDQHVVDDRALADDHLADRPSQPVEGHRRVAEALTDGSLGLVGHGSPLRARRGEGVMVGSRS